MPRIKRSGDDEDKINELVSRAQARQRFAGSFVAFPGSAFWSDLIRSALLNRFISGDRSFVRIHGDVITAHATRELADVQTWSPVAEELVQPDKKDKKRKRPPELFPFTLTINLSDFLRLVDEANPVNRIFVNDSLCLQDRANPPPGVFVGDSLRLRDVANQMAVAVGDSLRLRDRANPPPEVFVGDNLYLRDRANPSAEVFVGDSLRLRDETNPLGGVFVEDSLVISGEAYLRPRVFVEDALSLRDTVNISTPGWVQDTLLIIDTSTVRMTLLTAASDTLRLADIAAAKTGIRVAAQEAINVTDTPVVSIKLAVPVTDIIRLADVPTAALRLSFAAADLLKLTDAGVAQVRVAALTNDTVRLGDVAAEDTSDPIVSVSDTLILTGISQQQLRLRVDVASSLVVDTPTPGAVLLTPVGILTVNKDSALRLATTSGVVMGIPGKLTASKADSLRLATTPSIIMGIPGDLAVNENDALRLGTTTSAAVSTVVLPTVTVSATTPTARKIGEVAGGFTVTRTGSTAAALTVNYTMSGQATNGADYNTVSGSVVIGIGSSTAVVTITPIDTSVSVGLTETAILTISTNAAYVVGSPSNATVSINCNLIQDPGFESGTTSSWTVLGGTFTAVTTVKHSGAYSARLEGPSTDLGVAVISIPAAANADYELGFWHYTVLSAFPILVDIGHEANNVAYQTGSALYSVPSSTWDAAVPVAFTTVPGRTTIKITLRVHEYGAAGANGPRVDDFTLTRTA